MHLVFLNVTNEKQTSHISTDLDPLENGIEFSLNNLIHSRGCHVVVDFTHGTDPRHRNSTDNLHELCHLAL